MNRRHLLTTAAGAAIATICPQLPAAEANPFEGVVVPKPTRDCCWKFAMQWDLVTPGQEVIRERQAKEFAEKNGIDYSFRVVREQGSYNEGKDDWEMHPVEPPIMRVVFTIPPPDGIRPNFLIYDRHSPSGKFEAIVFNSHA